MPRLGRTGLDATYTPERLGRAMVFADSVLRGVGQVIFLDNSYTGLLCLIAVFLNAPLQGAAALAGTMASTGVAIALKADPDHVRSGLYGYNGCLVAIGGPQFLGSSATLLALVLLAAGASSALLLLFRRQNAVTLPALTIPFVLCSWLLILSLRAANPAGPATGGQRNVPVPISGLPADWSLIEATLNGIAQVYLQSGIIAGLLVALALLAGSRQAFLVACAAGFSSAAVASLIGVPELAIRSGLFGFNAVLAALALGVVYLRPGRTALVVAISAAAIMPVFQTFCALALVPLGLPTMSLPFIAATWLALFALRPLARPAT